MTIQDQLKILYKLLYPEYYARVERRLITWALLPHFTKLYVPPSELPALFDPMVAHECAYMHDRLRYVFPQVYCVSLLEPNGSFLILLE